jgi:hypothetical protein
MVTVVGLTLGIACGLAAAGDSEPNKPALSEKTLIVAPTGDDQNPGTEAKPLAGLAGARDRVRQWVAAGLQTNVQVLLRGGTYFLPETVRFDNRDSGTEAYSITYAAYPGEQVVVSGGRRIAGWQPSGTGGLWRAEVPEVKRGWYPRELYVNGKRATRARSPNDDGSSPYRVQRFVVSDDQSVWQVSLDPSIPFERGCEMENWKNIPDMEIFDYRQCNIVRKRLAQVDLAGKTFVLKPPHVVRGVPGGQLYGYCFLENALAFLDRPGEWYLDRATGEYWYLPRAGEDLTKAEAIAPVLTRLIQVRGKPGQPVRNLHFQGISFAHATWNLPQVGYMGAQASMFAGDNFTQLAPPCWSGEDQLERTDAALSFEYAVGCSIEDGEIAHLGGCGLELRRGCSANLVQGNRIFDIGGNGMSIGEPTCWIERPSMSGKADVVVSNRVMNNLIHACGATLQDAAAIWVARTEHTLIAQNEVYDLPQIGISVGWEWGGTVVNEKGNVVLKNHVYDVMKTMTDGGGIYTLGSQQLGVPTLKENVIHDVKRNVYLSNYKCPNAGFYYDEGGSKGFIVEDNVLFSIASKMWNFGWNGACAFRGNLACLGRSLFVKGVVGCGMLLDNTPYSLDVPDRAELEPTNLTVAAWVKFRTLPAGADPTVWIVNKNLNDLTDGYYALMASGREVGACLNIGGGRANRATVWSAAAPVQTNGWNQLALTYDGRDLKVYCNGAFQNSVSVNRPRGAGKGLLRLGNRADGQGARFDGWLDEVRIYARALSAEELRAQFEKPAAADMRNTPALVGYWPFDDEQARMQRILAEAGPAEPWRTRFGIKTLDVKTLEGP